MSASSPLFNYSPYITSLTTSNNSGSPSPGWLGMTYANGEELMTYGEDTDGTWIVVNNISCEYINRGGPLS